MKFDTKNIVVGALIAGIYFVVTMFIAPIAYGPIQFRISEILNLLAFFNPVYGIGVAIGCFLSNLASPVGVADVIIGTAATAISVYLMFKCKSLLVASLIPAVVNGIMIGAMLTCFTMLDTSGEVTLSIEFVQIFIPMALSVGISEFIICTIIGIPVFKILQKNKYFKENILNKSVKKVK